MGRPRIISEIVAFGRSIFPSEGSCSGAATDADCVFMVTNVEDDDDNGLLMDYAHV